MGTSAIFNCTVQIISGGVPITVNAEWRRNNTVINSSTPRHTLLKTTSESRTLITTGLRVDNTTLNDNDAVYTCTTNGAPGNFNTSVILSVTGGKYVRVCTYVFYVVFIDLFCTCSYICMHLHMYNLTVVTMYQLKVKLYT